MTFVSLSFGATRECVIPLLLVESLMNLVSLSFRETRECVTPANCCKFDEPCESHTRQKMRMCMNC